MASIRRFKKDIEFLIEEVVSDCCTFMYVYPEKKSDEAIQIIQDAIAFRDKLFAEVNNPQENPLKAYYKTVNRELLEGVDALFQRISDLTK